MIQNYVKIATRSIFKRKLYSFINAFGLSIGIAFCTLIYFYIQDERSFDQFHENKERIYRVEAKTYDTWQNDPSNPYRTSASLQLGLMQALQDEIPEVEFATRFSDGASGVLWYGEKMFTEQFTYVDSQFFSMFSFKMVRGSREKLFSSKTDIVLTPAIATKYFGDADPVGAEVEIDVEGVGKKSFIVTGVIESPPANSSIDFEILIPQENRVRYEQRLASWGSFNTPTFVQLRPGSDESNFKVNLDKVVEKHMADRLKKWREQSDKPIPEEAKMLEYVFTALPDVHLKKDVGWHKASDPQYSYILGGIAVLILVIACINYISLALTTSTSRRMEVGIRKSVGAQRKQLIYQFGIESILLALASMVIGLGLVFLFLPSFNEFTGKGISISLLNVFQLLGVTMILTFLVGALAGSYPALFLSGFRPALVLKGRFTSKVQAGFTKPLVVLQFVLSAFLIISSVIMYRQMRFVTTKDLGYDQEQLITVKTQEGWTDESDRLVERFRPRVLQEPGIISVTGTNAAFTQGYDHWGYKVKGESKSAYIYCSDAYYVSTMGIEIVQGRDFDPSIPSDTFGIIVNEALVRDMKWKDPMNEYLNWKEDTVGMGMRVIGVAKDYHFRSLEEDIEPMLLTIDRKGVGHFVNMIVKVAPGDLPGKLEALRKAWKDVSPDKPFEYTFLEEDVAKQYESYQRWMSIMGFATGFAILISCLGLFGLAGINAVNKTKEIGIRKVMGAELSNIFVLLNRQYIWLSLIAFAIAAPASYYIMNRWLGDFKYKITISWELFAVSMGTGILIALATVSYHTLKAAFVNPADTLKYE